MVLDNNKIEEIWEKATVVPDYDSARWRQDFAGAWIQREQYGLSSEYGWDVCHLVPVSHGGSNAIDNLRPIHWKNHQRKANNYPVFRTSVTSQGDKNVNDEQVWRIVG